MYIYKILETDKSFVVKKCHNKYHLQYAQHLSCTHQHRLDKCSVQTSYLCYTYLLICLYHFLIKFLTFIIWEHAIKTLYCGATG